MLWSAGKRLPLPLSPPPLQPPSVLPSLAAWRAQAVLRRHHSTHATASRKSAGLQKGLAAVQHAAEAHAELAPEARLQQEAVRGTLKGVMLRHMGSGRYVAPLFQADSGLPWLLALELQYAHAGPDPLPLGLASRDCMFSVQYCLDGQALVDLGLLAQERLHAGDSLLLPPGDQVANLAQSSRKTIQGVASGADGYWAGDAPELAMLTLLLPDTEAAEGSACASHVARAAAAWAAAPVVGQLSPRAAAGILDRAKAAARGAFQAARNPYPATNPSSSPGSSHAAPQPARGPANGQLGGLEAEPSEPTGMPARVSDEGAERPAGGFGEAAAKMAGFVIRGGSDGEPGGGAVDLGLSVGARWEAHWQAGAAALSEAVREALAHTQVDVLRYVLPSIAARLGGNGRGSAAALKRSLLDLVAFRLPGQTNRLALIYDPLSDQVPFTFGVEIFEAGHRTTPHSHASAHELFFILAGEGEGFCDECRFPLAAGDVVVFPPRSMHGIDVADAGRLYALELMQPNDMFAELVKAGRPTGGLRPEDLCVLASLGCGA